jgi:hypothetical protein
VTISVGITKIFQSPKRIERLLHTYLVAALDVQIDYYSSLPNFQASWIVQIIGNTVNSFIGLFPLFASGQKYRDGLLRAAAEHVKTRNWNLSRAAAALHARPDRLCAGRVYNLCGALWTPAKICRTCRSCTILGTHRTLAILARQSGKRPVFVS